MVTHVPLLTCLAGLLIAISGCGSQDPLNRQSVTGMVTLNGQPMPQGMIQFSPEGDSGTMSGAAITEGQYTLPAEKGLSPGEYLVRISSASAETAEPDPDEVAGDFVAPKKELVPPEYNSQSQQKVTVEAGKQNVFDFTIP